MLMFDYFRVRSYLALEVDSRLGKNKVSFSLALFLKRKKEKPTETSLWLLVVELHEPE